VVNLLRDLVRVGRGLLARAGRRLLIIIVVVVVFAVAAGLQ
jgi:hypothetical protein